MRLILLFLLLPTITIFSQSGTYGQSSDNSIVVGPPKLYDERSLESLLGAVENGLTGQNGAGVNFVNSGAVAAHEGSAQGGESNDSSVSANLEKLPDSGFQPSPTTSTSTSPRAYSFALPSAPGVASSYSPSWQTGTSTTVNNTTAPISVSPSDTLQQQVGLSFQATNLALLLQHSVSDRLILENNRLVPRKLAVLGFQITVEPTTQDKNRAAVVDITLSNPPGAAAPPQVVMMLPQDKTYNVAQVTNNSRSIGLGAISMPLVGSLSASTNHDSAYIVYDVDTVALQRQQSADANSVTFGWEFRPVLGQAAVQPGTRQVFVLVALPESAQGPNVDPQTAPLSYQPDMSVSTYWEKIDTKTKTLNPSDPSPVRTDLSLAKLPIYDLNTYEDGLAPIIDKIDFYDAGNQQLYIEAEGQNFTSAPTTSIVYSGQNFAAATETGGRLLAFTAPVSAVSFDDPVIIGPYGLPVPLVQPELTDSAGKAIDPGTPGEGIAIDSVNVAPADQSNSTIRITLRAKNSSGTDPVAPRLPENAQMLITVGSLVYGLNDMPIGKEASETSEQTSTALPTFDIQVPNAALQSAQKVTVRYLFASGPRYNDDYKSDYALPVSTFRVDSVSIVSRKGKVVLAITGVLPGDLTAVINDVAYTPAADSTQGAYLELNPNSPIEQDSPGGPPDVTKNTSSKKAAPGHTSGHGANGSTASHSYRAGSSPPHSGTQPTPVSRGPVGEYVEPLLDVSTNLTVPPPADQAKQTYAVALLYTSQAELISGADTIVLYKPGYPSQLLSLTQVIKTLKSPIGTPPPAPTPTTPSQSMPSISVSINGAPAQATGSGANTAASPSGPQNTTAGIYSTTTVTKNK